MNGWHQQTNQYHSLHSYSSPTPSYNRRAYNTQLFVNAFPVVLKSSALHYMTVVFPGVWEFPSFSVFAWRNVMFGFSVSWRFWFFLFCPLCVIQVNMCQSLFKAVEFESGIFILKLSHWNVFVFIHLFFCVACCMIVTRSFFSGRCRVSARSIFGGSDVECRVGTHALQAGKPTGNAEATNDDLQVTILVRRRWVHRRFVRAS